MHAVRWIMDWLPKIIGLLMAYKFLYYLLGFFGKKKTYPATQNLWRWAIVICARNEEAVIGPLLDSIAAQDYPGEALTTYVVADNCRDHTADIARARGAVVMERQDPAHARKGYALGWFFERLEAGAGVTAYDGFLFFDADNLLETDFVTRINEAMETGTDIAVGYRNTKNFDTNFISAGYGIHFYRSSALMHRPRAILGLSTHLAGTGFAIRSELLREGWKWFCLTEDTQLTLWQIARGRHVAFVEDAVFYDEQPHDAKTVIRQRIRWEKGRLFAFLTTFPRLFLGIFKSRGERFSCYDMFFYSFPRGLVSALLSIVWWVAGAVTALIGGAGIAFSPLTPLKALGVGYLSHLALNILAVIRERRRIPCGRGKLFFYTLLSPWFSLISVPLAVIALFMRVRWKPIRHDEVRTLSDLEEKLTREKNNRETCVKK